MELAQTRYDNSETGCCARVDVDQWDAHEFNWQDKLFLKDHVRSFLHLPLNFGTVISRNNEMIERAKAYPMDPVSLTDEVSLWGSDVFVAVDHEIPGANIVKLSGTFLTRVFEGPYRNVGKWTKEMEDYVKSKGHELKKMYYYYATCPKCAKQFGANHVVLFAQVS